MYVAVVAEGPVFGNRCRRRVLMWIVFERDNGLVYVLGLGGDLSLFHGLWGDISLEPVGRRRARDMFRGLVVVGRGYRSGHFTLYQYSFVQTGPVESVYLISIPARSKHVRAMLNSLPRRTYTSETSVSVAPFLDHCVSVSMSCFVATRRRVTDDSILLICNQRSPRENKDVGPVREGAYSDVARSLTLN